MQDDMRLAVPALVMPVDALNVLVRQAVRGAIEAAVEAEATLGRVAWCSILMAVGVRTTGEQVVLGLCVVGGGGARLPEDHHRAELAGGAGRPHGLPVGAVAVAAHDQYDRTDLERVSPAHQDPGRAADPRAITTVLWGTLATGGINCTATRR